MATATKTETKSKGQTKTTAKKATTAAKPAPKTNAEIARERALQTAETAVDIPVGAALTVYERASEAVEPFGTASKREAELKRVRTQLRRELNKVERRGGTARRRARAPSGPGPVGRTNVPGHPGRVRARRQGGPVG